MASLQFMEKFPSNKTVAFLSLKVEVLRLAIVVT